MLTSGDRAALHLAVLAILLLLSSFFSSAETALTTVNRMRIRTLADAGDKKAKILQQVIDDPGRMLSTILVGNNLVNLSASSLMTSLVIQLFGNAAVGIATGILTLLILVFGEISPKTIATLHAEKLALRYAGVIHTLMIVLTPVIWAVNLLAICFLRLMGVNPDEKPEVMTEDELRTIVEVSHEEGVIESEEKKMINNVVDFGDAVAKDVMVPRIDMVFAEVNMTYTELLEIFRREKYTRLPVYENTTDNVIGILNMKDLLMYDGEREFTVRENLRQPLYTYEFKKLAELMVEMRRTYNNLVIVLDEYGATAGLLTLEDMLEEIVGEIRDEYDEDEEEDIQLLEEGTWLVNGSMKLDDLNEQLGLSLESEDYDSIGGLFVGQLEHLPVEGETVQYEDLDLKVEHMEGNRIGKIRLQLIIPPIMPPAEQQANMLMESDSSGSSPQLSTNEMKDNTAK